MWFAFALITVAFWFFRSPLASAAADAIRKAFDLGLPHVDHNGVRIRDPRLEEGLAHMTDELSQLREQFSELAERVDFTERALAEVRRRDALPNPRS